MPLFLLDFSVELQEYAHSFPAQRAVIEPTRRTAAVLSQRVVYPCSRHERNCKRSDRNRAPLHAAFHLTEKIMKDALRLMKGYIFHEIDRFSLKLFCSSQWQNLLRVNARTEGYWQVSLRSWRICLGARLTFWRRSCDKKREWGRGV